MIILKYNNKFDSIKIIVNFFLFILLNNTVYQYILSQEKFDYDPSKPIVRFSRIYSSRNELLPPILRLTSNISGYNVPLATDELTFEFDVSSPVPPNVYAKFIHCSVDWQEDENVFLSDLVFSRTSNISWESAPFVDSYYSYRGKIQFPNQQVKLKFAGNWKIKIYDYDNDTLPLVEAKFFVVDAKSNCQMRIISDFYLPMYNVAPSGLIIETDVLSFEQLIDSRLNTLVLYKNNRWEEPYYISEDLTLENKNRKYKYRFPTMVSGIASAGKRFRIESIPADNGYRILNLTNLAEYPRIKAPIQMPFSDLRRRGFFDEYDDDGAMITSYVSYSNDDYVLLEFLLDPDGWISEDEVYVVGSFNNWTLNKNWQMYYDEEQRYYRLRQWIRRARHNYLYATGRFNFDSNTIDNISFDEMEGTTANALHTYIGFVYYKEIDFGGYDSIIGVGAANIFGPVK